MKTESRALRGGTIVLMLPFPPSTNGLYPTGTNGRRFASKEYTEWKIEAGYKLKTQRPFCAVGPVHISIKLQDRTRSFDPDNRVKALIDLIVAHGLIESDTNKIVRSIMVTVDPGVIGASVEISSVPGDFKRGRGW